MSRIKPVTILAEKIRAVAPELKFTACYRSRDPEIEASIRLYKNRAFIYILSIKAFDEDNYIYVGQSKAQYERIIQHRASFAFDKVYLFECEKGQLSHAEDAVISLLKPMFNRQKNPLYERYKNVLQIDYHTLNSRDMVIKHLIRWHEYNAKGLYGFALSPTVYSVLANAAGKEHKTVSEKMQEILENVFIEDIHKELKDPCTKAPETNLVTTIDYGRIHSKSQEQIKQYLHQDDRLLGKKFGRDWVVIDDERFPEDRRKRNAI